ncbi:MAG: tetratricopeptide repeat protein, partial [bacterium]
MDAPDLRLETALNLLHLAANMDLATRGAEALRYVHAAETVLPDMPVELRIRAALLRARVAGAANQLDDAAKWADEAVNMARRHRLSHRLGMALALRGEVEVRRHAYKAALPLLEQGTALMRRAKAARTEENVRALTSLGTTYLQLGRLDAARRTYKRVEQLAVRLGLDPLYGKALSGLGLVEWLRRRFDSAAKYLTEARDVF